MKLKSQAIVVGILIGSLTVSYLSSTVLVRRFPRFTALPLLTIILTVFTLLLGTIIGLVALMAIRPPTKQSFREWMRKKAMMTSKGEGAQYGRLILGAATMCLSLGSIFTVEQVRTVLFPMIENPSIAYEALGMSHFLFTIIYFLLGVEVLLPFLVTIRNEER